MEFKASLRLPCARPEVVRGAMCSEDTAILSLARYSVEDGCLVVSVSAGGARDLAKSITSVMSRFRLSVETLQMCKELMGGEGSG